MWTRVLFAVRSFTIDLGPRLGSWRLSIVLMVLAALYYLFLAIWATSSPPQVVRNIASLAPFWLLYALLLVNTGVCLWRRLGVLRKQIGRAPILAGREAEWSLPIEGEMGEEEAQDLLRRLGYRPFRAPEGGIGGVRRRWAALGTFLFHGAFFLVALGFLLTLATRQEGRIWVAAGESFEGRPDQFLSVSAPKPLVAGVPARPFRLDEIRPEFWRDQLLFTTLEADLELAGRKKLTRINRPLWLGWGTFLRLSGFGYAPRYAIEDAQGRLLDSAFVKLNVFPPGQRDYFSPPDYPHRIYVRVYPDFERVDGEPRTRSLNLANPAVGVQVLRGRFDRGKAVLLSGERLRFEGLALRFPEIRYWGEFTILFDPGAPVLFLGYLLGLAGLALKLPGGRAEAEWRPAPGGGELRGWGSPRPRRLPPGLEPKPREEAQ
jgi:hypothetical protein